MMGKVLGSQLQRNIIAYVDDVVVMSKRKEDHIKDIQETFVNLRSARLKLNPKKCVFGVSKGKCWGTSSAPRESELTQTKQRQLCQWQNLRTRKKCKG